MVTLDRPPLNLLTFNMLGELNDVLDEAAATPIRSLLLRAGGEHFMGGADVHVFDGVSTREARRVFERGLPVLAK